jgi:protein-S-isoprenylcysteine O-methyltransferase Ste14
MKEKKLPVQQKIFAGFNYLVALLLFIFPQLVSGDWKWWQAWANTILSLMAIVVSRIIAIRINPGMAKERMRAGASEDTKSWDKVIVPIVAIYLPLVILLIIGLDRRFHWSPGSTPVFWIIAIVLIILGAILSTWAMAANAFFSSHVRIQGERGQQVIKSGPYKLIRHPGYFGGILYYVSLPLLLGSLWSLIPIALLVILLIVRTVLEEHTLINELAGYKEYMKETRYRWIPGIW